MKIAIPPTVNQQFGQRWHRVHVSLPPSVPNQQLRLLVGAFESAFVD